MKCWRCEHDLEDGARFCSACGAVQERVVPTTEIGRTLRALYDRHGAEELLTHGERIVEALGASTEETKKARGLLRLALDAGVGQLVLEQLRTKGCWDGAFLTRAIDRLADEAGMNGKAAVLVMLWLNEMIGWPQEREPSAPTRLRRSSKILGIDLGGAVARAAVTEGGQISLIPNRSGGVGRPCAVGYRGRSVVLCEEALRQAISRPEETALSFKRMIVTGRKIEIGDDAYSPQLLSALVLRKLRQDAAEYLGEDPVSAVITVPNSYTSAQRQAVISAGRMAGLNVMRLINDTSSAALAHGCLQDGDQKLLVCDLGATSFSTAVMIVGDGVAEVLASAGDARLGGDDFTQRIVYWAENEFRRSTGVELSEDPAAAARLGEAAEKAKKELSDAMTAQIFLPSIAVRDGEVLHFDQTLSRDAFNKMTATLRERARDLIQGVLNDAMCSGAEIERILFVGGGSRMPAMRDMIRQLLGKDILALERPDEYAVRGAAVQASLLSGETRGIVLLEATTHSLGVETAGGVCTRLISRNTTYPATAARSFSTFADKQTTVDIHVLEGESEKAADNETFGRFQIKDIPPAPKGVPSIEVRFDIDANGVINVSAKDAGTGTERRMSSFDIPGISEDQIRRNEDLVDRIVTARKE